MQRWQEFLAVGSAQNVLWTQNTQPLSRDILNQSICLILITFVTFVNVVLPPLISLTDMSRTFIIVMRICVLNKQNKDFHCQFSQLPFRSWATDKIQDDQGFYRVVLCWLQLYHKVYNCFVWTHWVQACQPPWICVRCLLKVLSHKKCPEKS